MARFVSVFIVSFEKYTHLHVRTDFSYQITIRNIHTTTQLHTNTVNILTTIHVMAKLWSVRQKTKTKQKNISTSIKSKLANKNNLSSEKWIGFKCYQFRLQLGQFHIHIHVLSFVYSNHFLLSIDKYKYKTNNQK